MQQKWLGEGRLMGYPGRIARHVAPLWLIWLIWQEYFCIKKTRRQYRRV